MNMSAASTTELLDSKDEQSNEVCEEGKRPENQDDPSTEGQTPHIEGSVQSDCQRETQSTGSQSKGRPKRR